jgi:hypothetical protein
VSPSFASLASITARRDGIQFASRSFQIVRIWRSRKFRPQFRPIEHLFNLSELVDVLGMVEDAD